VGALAAYVDGRADEEAAARIEAHLAGCPACVGILADVRESATEPMAIAPAERLARIRALRPAPGPTARRWVAWGAVAASVAIACLAGSDFGRKLEREVASARRASAAPMTPTGLPDLGFSLETPIQP
jgi:anti-sigma factor RsiW